MNFFTSATRHLFKIRRCGYMATAATISRGTTVAIADVNRRKCGRYTRYLRNFDGPLGLSGCRRQCFLTSATCYFFEKRWRESVITAVAVSHGACRHRLHFAIARKIRNFALSFFRLSCVAASRILLYTNTHHQMGQQEEPVIDTCSPRRQAI